MTSEENDKTMKRGLITSRQFEGYTVPRWKEDVDPHNQELFLLIWAPNENSLSCCDKPMHANKQINLLSNKTMTFILLPGFDFFFDFFFFLQFLKISSFEN